MVDAGLCVAGGNDAQQDFDGIFETHDLAGYLDRSGLRRERDWPVALKSALVMGCTLCGAALAVAGSQRAAWFRACGWHRRCSPRDGCCR